MILTPGQFPIYNFKTFNVGPPCVEWYSLMDRNHFVDGIGVFPGSGKEANAGGDEPDRTVLLIAESTPRTVPASDVLAVMP